MLRTFQKIRFGLLVGVAGGAPGPPDPKDARKDIRLGDVVVSCPADDEGAGGVLQVDYGKRLTLDEFKLTGHLNKPPPVLLAGVKTLRSDLKFGEAEMNQNIQTAAERAGELEIEGHSFPGRHQDQLFKASYSHLQTAEGKPKTDCSDCETGQIQTRMVRVLDDPVVHYGLIASGNQVVRSAEYRDDVRKKFGILCFEMEAAGLMDTFPCLVIRGISDYSDGHKNKAWQPYAATTAAAYARDLLRVVRPSTVERERLVVEVVDAAQAKTESQENQRHLEQMSVAEEHRDISQDSLEWQKYKLPIQHNALHDSDAVSRHTPFCHKDTRKSILKQIAEWAESIDSETIFWLSGHAGTGKSTIARTIAHQLEKTEPEAQVRLGASFFFKIPDRSCSTELFPTIATQLIHSIPQLKRHVWNSLDSRGWLGEANIAGKAPEQQFETLILNPIKDLNKDLSKQYPVKPTRVIVIDALDECEKKDIPMICTQLLRLQELHAVRLRVFLTSRSTETICGAFKLARSLSWLDPSEAKADIEKFLKDRFAELKDKKNIGDDWPIRKDLDRLLTLATTPSPLFIYAETLCRYVENDMKGVPTRRLNDWLEHEHNVSELGGDQLNRMYEMVLYDARLGLDDSEKQLLEDLLRFVVLLTTQLPAASLAALLDLEDNVVKCLLPALHAVLDVRPDRPVDILHESFRNFLLGRKGTCTDDFRVDATETHALLVLKCIDRMKRKDDGARKGLRRGMFDDKDYGQATDGFGKTISKVIPLDLEYACLNWVYHLQQCNKPINVKGDKALLQKVSDLLQKAKSFLEKHFLHWVETLSLLGKLSEGVSSIRQLRRITQSIYDPGLDFAAFLKDAERFTVSYGAIIGHHPLQIYGAALAFCPPDSDVHKRFGAERYPDIPNLTSMRTGWDQCLQTLKVHGGSVNAVAFSPNGKLLVSASSDQTVRVWDGSVGSYKQTLKGHNGYVLAVAFSPNGMMLASASSDRTIWLWDIETGTHTETFKGHDGWVNAVAFSRDGKLLASASSDQTVRLWDMETGTHTRTLKGHGDWVNAVAFSGKLLVSASNDRTVRLWDIETGTHTETFKGHDGWVNAVAFSRDGKLLASASSDQTVRLWDIETSTHTRTLKGHGGWVNAVAFSRDGKLLASASSDRIVRLWNLATGDKQTLEGHSDWVNAVAFSCNHDDDDDDDDDEMLVSASSDSMVRVWDTAIGAHNQTFESHGGSVSATVFSPNGEILASASSDGTVRLWDIEKGNQIRTLEHRDPTMGSKQTVEGRGCHVLAVAFSPDGKMLASASSDRTVRLWDIRKGTHIRTLKHGNPTTGNKQALEDHDCYILAVAFSPDGKMLASASSDWRVWLWDIEGNTPERIFEGHRNWVTAIAFSPSGKLLASASRDGTVRLWGVKKDNKQKLEGNDGLAEDHVLVSDSNDLRVRHCVIYEGSLARPDHGDRNWVRAIAFTPDSRVLVSHSSDGTVRLLEVDEESRKKTPEGLLAVAFAFDGKVLEMVRHVSKPSQNPDQPGDALVSPPPPRTDLDSMWEYLRKCISKLMHNGLAAMDMRTKAVGSGPFTHLAGEELYNKLDDYLTEHVEQLVAISRDHTDEALLAFYTQEWDRYSVAAKYTHFLFRYLNRHWVKRELDEGKKNVYDVYTLHLVKWGTVFVESVSERVMDAILKLVEKQRNGETIDYRKIRQIVDSFVRVGFDKAGYTTSLDVYRFHFQRPFLKATALFYQAESKRLIAENSIKYMKKVEARLDEEGERVRMYLHADILNPLMRTCDQALIADHSNILQSQFQDLLNNGREQDMARTFKLLSRIADGLDPLLAKFQPHLRTAGLAAVAKAASGAAKLEPKIYVGPVQPQYQGFVPWSLNDETLLIGSSDNAMTISEDWIARAGRNLGHMCSLPQQHARRWT
ncbi:hypothetical protein Neosp_011986 [[Neocosmospora] mangrovei]